MTTKPPTPTRLYGPPILGLDLPGFGAGPALWRWVLATLAAVAVSLLACLGLVHLATALLPDLSGYGHFQFGDYSRLTVVGVIGACVGWPVVTWLTTSARRLYLWSAVVVTVVSLAPDVWILHLGQPLLGVVTLGVMHVALGVVTYGAMVVIAPARPAATPSAPTRSESNRLSGQRSTE